MTEETPKTPKQPEQEGKPEPEEGTALDKLIQEFDADEEMEKDLDDLDAFLSDEDMLEGEDDEDYSFLDDEDDETAALLADGRRSRGGGLIGIAGTMLLLLLGCGVGWLGWLNRDAVMDGVNSLGGHIETGGAGLVDTLQQAFPADETSFMDEAVSFDLPPRDEDAIDLLANGDAAATIESSPVETLEGDNALFFDFEAISREEENEAGQAVDVAPMAAVPASDFPAEPLIDQQDIEQAAEVMRAQTSVLKKEAAAKPVAPSPSVQSRPVPAVSSVNRTQEAAVTRRLNETAALLGQAKLAQRNGNQQEAFDLYARILDIDPDHPVAGPAHRALAALVQNPVPATVETAPSSVMSPMPAPAAPVAVPSVPDLPLSQPGNAAQALFKQALTADQRGEFARALDLYREALRIDAVQYNGLSLDRGQVYDRISIVRERLGQ